MNLAESLKKKYAASSGMQQLLEKAERVLDGGKFTVQELHQAVAMLLLDKWRSQ